MEATAVLTPIRALRRRRGRTWVTKTDLVRYLRCPYAFWQIDCGALAPDAALDALGAQLVEDGREFHAAVAADAFPLPPRTTLAEAFAGEATVHGLPLLRNRALRIAGVPDAVDPAGGQLVPVEAKSHKDVRRSDELELAFYWRLLEPYRIRGSGRPRGRLVLRRDGVAVDVDIEIARERFVELDGLIAQVRRARRDGVRPRVCGCSVCSGPLRQEVRQRTREGCDLTLIFGVGRRIAARLEALGISDYHALRRCDPAALAVALRRFGVCRSPAQVLEWCHHAASYQCAAPVTFGAPPSVGDAFIALDLEYDPFNPHVWLTGLLIADRGRREHLALWADTPAAERRALRALIDVCATHPALPILTWAGVSADLPKLRDAARRHDLTGPIAAVAARHVDLYQHAARTIRLPIPDMALGAVAGYLSIPKTSAISGGLEAQMRYAEYRACSDPERRAALRAELTAYNRDDLDALADVLRALQTLGTSEPVGATAGQDHADGRRVA